MPDTTTRVWVDVLEGTSNELFMALLDSLPSHIAILNDEGVIVAVNRAWREFGAVNSGGHPPIAEGFNYLSVCDEIRGEDRQLSANVARAIRNLLTEKNLEDYVCDYSCYARQEPRWYQVRVSRLNWDGPARVMVTHEPITKQKLVMDALGRRTQQSAIFADVIRIGVAPRQSLQVMLQEVAATLVRHLDAAFARVWMIDPTGTVLELQASAGMYTHLDGPHSRVLVGQYKIGRIAKNRQPHLTNDVLNDSQVSDNEWAHREGLVSFAGYPLFVAGELVGVMALFSRLSLATETLEVLERLADVVGQAIGHKEAESALRESEQRFRLLIENAADAFFLHDEKGKILDVNQRACECLGYSRSDLLNCDLGDIVVGFRTRQDHWPLKHVAIGETTTFEGEHRRFDGTSYPVEVRTAAFETGDRRLFIALARDVTEAKRAASQLEYQAEHDSLTGLPNRVLLAKIMAEALADAQRSGGKVALLLMDLDRFKEINDTFGHHYGDIVLQQLNSRLRAGLRAVDEVARLGGDEFAILLPGADCSEAVTTAERILHQTTRPIEVNEQRLYVGGSIGIALYPDHAADPDGLLQHADVAMYAAKRARAGIEVYSADQSLSDPQRLSLVADLSQAVANSELQLYYQPKVDLRTGQVQGAEALARWPHPTRGMIAPSLFIPLAEHTGLIRPIGIWALEMAVRQCVEWRANGLDLSIAVNLAADNLQDPKLCGRVARIIENLGGSTGWLTVEVTESTMMADPVRAKTVLNWLHDLGIKVAIDDFGTGYSSLAYLKEMPADEVKIDRSFIKELTSDRHTACITRAVIDLGHNLGLKVVAEGVEDRVTFDLLKNWGCDLVQGYYFSPPLPAERFVDWVEQTRIEIGLQTKN